MSRSQMIRQLLSAPPALRTALVACPQSFRTINPHRNYSSTLPGISQTSFWTSLIPKPLRRDARQKNTTKKPRSKEWNPATFYIVIFLLIGSMSIQMIALRNESVAFGRKADAKIGLLKEVIERIQNGEDVDVEGLLGTGNKAQEKEWAEVLEEIQNEDNILREAKQKKSNKPTSPSNTDTSTSKVIDAADASKTSKPVKSNAPSGFY